MPVFQSHDILPNYILRLHLHYITTFCSLISHDIVIHVLKISFLALSVVLFNSILSFLYYFLRSLLLIFFWFLRSSILLIISCVIHCFLAFLSILPIKSLILSNTHFLVLLHRTSTFQLSNSIAARVFYTFLL